VLLRALRVVPEGRIVSLLFELVYVAEFAGIVKVAPEVFSGDH
jgi:hypothetical protein